MKSLLSAIASALLLSSCVFESPFDPTAAIATDQALLGKWESTSDPAKPLLLVLQHSANEYTVQYPVGAKALFFRAYAIDLEGDRYLQLQLIGSADGPVEAADRKYHLLKATSSGDTLELRTIAPEVLGARAGDSAALRAAFAKHRGNPKLFGEPTSFKRVN